MEEVAQLLIGTKYERGAIAEKLKNIEIPTYFGGVSEEDFLQLIY